jgi:serine phosphatase RsbU (regulator of sigma subunit)/Tfp pilus assembly protein PilF
VIQFSKNNIAKANAYVELSEIVYFSDVDSVIPLCSTAIKILDTGRTDTMRSTRYKVLNIKAHALNNIGSIYYEKHDIPKALDYYFEGLKLREASGDVMGIAESLNNLGVLYKSQKNYDKAIENYKKSLELYIQANNGQGEATALGNIGGLYADENKNDIALVYFKRGLEVADSIGYKNKTATLLNYIGTIYEKEDNHEQDALKYCMRALDIETEIGDKEGCAGTLHVLAKIEQDINNNAKAIEYGTKALLLSQEIGSPQNIMNNAKLLYNVYNQQKKWKDALDMHVLYTATYDSINAQEKNKETLQKTFQFEYERKAAQLKTEQEKKDIIAQADSKRQTIALLLVLIVALAAGIIAILVFRSLRITRKQKVIIEEQKSLVEQKNKDILDSIAYAKRLQEAILPPLNELKQILPESFVLYKPKDIVAGDFYWMQQSDNKTFIAACDCTGHGVPGAMVSVVCSNALYRAVKEFNITEPGKILDKTRELVIETFQKSSEEVRDGMDVSLCVLTPAGNDQKSTLVQWSGANNPLVYVQDNEMKEIIADKQPIGVQDGHKDFTTHTLTLNPGDNLYLFSDGYADQFGGPKGKKFKSRPFKELIRSISFKKMEEQRDVLNQSFETWKSDFVQTDDVCVIGIRI